VASRGDRFRQLRTPGTADLFEHFGVQAEAGQTPALEPAEAAPLVAAAACEHCGWYRALPMAGTCPVCGAPGREAPRGEAPRGGAPRGGAPHIGDGSTA
jgi:hypothetical protein